MNIGRRLWAPGNFLGAMMALGILIAAVPAAAQREPAKQLGLLTEFTPASQSDQSDSQSQSQPSPQNPQTPPCPPATQSDQKPPPCPAPGDAKAADQTKTDQNAKPDAAGTSKDRLFYALPNFLTLENAKQLPPLTAGQKFKVVARSSFDYVEFPWYGILAGISQANNSEPGYGQGAQGYAKRYGAAFADGTIENFMTGAVMASLLRQDPRFYQTSDGGFMHRVGYAMSRIFITRTDAGGEQFNYSEIVGSALSAGISTYSYHPHADKNVSNTLSVWGTQIGYDTITIVIKEFWPDIRRKFSRKDKSEVVLQ